MSDPCQVDFYLLARPGLDARRMACRLALMAWERGQQSIVIAENDEAARQLDELMWASPADRFLPHELDLQSAQDKSAEAVPILITVMSRLSESSLDESGLSQFELVINLCPQAIQEPARFKRLLEIVPHENDARQASREKFKYYRGQGITPGTHEINK